MAEETHYVLHGTCFLLKSVHLLNMIAVLRAEISGWKPRQPQEKANLYVSLRLGDVKHRMHVVADSLLPVWNEPLSL